MQSLKKIHAWAQMQDPLSDGGKQGNFGNKIDQVQGNI